MKTFLIILIVLVGAIITGWFVMQPGEIPVEELAEIGAEVMVPVEPLVDGRYVLVASESAMAWQGDRPFLEGYFDNGVISIASGGVIVASGSVTQGSVVIDMTTISAESTGRGDGETKLTSDLKSDKWFDVDAYPESLFIFSSYEDNGDGTTTVTGELTIKDITNSLTFPAVISSEEGRIIFQASEIGVDRTKWDLVFQSGSVLDDLGEKLIGDIFELTFTAVFEVEEHEDAVMENEIMEENGSAETNEAGE